MENNRTIRQMRSAPIDFKTREIDGEKRIEGYFSVFGAFYELWDGNRETVQQGAFAETLDGDIRALINHNTDLVLGRTTAGTLELREDENGLWGSILINEQDTDALNLYARVQRGDVSQCSFGFDILEESYKVDDYGNVTWIIEKVRLYEVSVVTFPAYPDTNVQARKADFEVIQQRKREQLETWKETARKKLKGE